jgi:hypothetical protein
MKKSKFLSVVSVLTLLLCGVFLSGQVSNVFVASADDLGDRDYGFGKKVAGSYLFEFVPEVTPPVSVFGVFFENGTLITTDTGDAPGPTVSNSPGHAVWERDGRRSMRVVHYELNFDLDGVLDSFFRVSGTLEFDRRFNEFSGAVILEILSADSDPLDPDAEPLSVIPAVVTGRRITVP